MTKKKQIELLKTQIAAINAQTESLKEENEAKQAKLTKEATVSYKAAIKAVNKASQETTKEVLAIQKDFSAEVAAFNAVAKAFDEAIVDLEGGNFHE